MRKFVYIFYIAVFFYSCDKPEELITEIEEIELSTEKFELGTLQKILNGYHIRAINFDSKGNAWIGTFKQGLIQYSAEKTVFYNSDNSIIPEDFIVYNIAIDKNDNVWIGGSGESCGLLMYDGKEFSLYSSQNTPMPLNYVKAIEVDSKNNIWFASCNINTGGIVKFDGTKWIVYTPDNSILPYNLVNSIAIDQSDNVWVSYYNHLVKISNSAWKIFSCEDLGFTPYIPRLDSGLTIKDIKINSNNFVVGTIDYAFFNFDDLPDLFPIPKLPVMFIFDGKMKIKIVLWKYFFVGIETISIDHNDYVWCSQNWGGNLYGVWLGGKHGGIIDGSIIDPSEFLPYITIMKESPDNKIWFGTGDGIVISDNK